MKVPEGYDLRSAFLIPVSNEKKSSSNSHTLHEAGISTRSRVTNANTTSSTTNTNVPIITSPTTTRSNETTFNIDHHSSRTKRAIDDDSVVWW